jgi:hypothetical protein
MLLRPQMIVNCRWARLCDKALKRLRCHPTDILATRGLRELHLLFVVLALMYSIARVSGFERVKFERLKQPD